MKSIVCRYCEKPFKPLPNKPGYIDECPACLHEIPPCTGQWGTSAPFYNDYRYQRRPNEAVNFGRNFRMKERVTFQARLEFTNIFNRAQAANPNAPFGPTNAKATQTRDANGVTTGGFGWINYTATGQSPRQGQMVLRLTF